MRWITQSSSADKGFSQVGVNSGQRHSFFVQQLHQLMQVPATKLPVAAIELGGPRIKFIELGRQCFSPMCFSAPGECESLCLRLAHLDLQDPCQMRTLGQSV